MLNKVCGLLLLALMFVNTGLTQIKSAVGMEEDSNAEVRGKIDERFRVSQTILKDLLSGKVNIPEALLNKAKCVIVIPSVKKLAFTVGGSYGRGVMTCRLGENYNGRWSAPSMYALEGGNFGLQIGAQATDLVLLVMNERGVESLLKSKVRLGGDASVAAGPIGRNLQAATDLGMRAQILSYSRSGGVFAGIAIEGSTLRPDTNANDILYGKDVTNRQIVRSGIKVPAAARPLVSYLDERVSASTGDASTQAKTEKQ